MGTVIYYAYENIANTVHTKMVALTSKTCYTMHKQYMQD